MVRCIHKTSLVFEVVSRLSGCFCIKTLGKWLWPGADPGYPRGDANPKSGGPNLLCGHFFPENCMKFNKMRLRGAQVRIQDIPEGTPIPKVGVQTYCVAIFSPKTAWNLIKLDWEGRIFSAPLDVPLGAYKGYILPLNAVWVVKTGGEDTRTLLL